MHFSFSRSNVCPPYDILSIFPLPWQPTFIFDSFCRGSKTYRWVFYLTMEQGSFFHLSQLNDFEIIQQHHRYLEILLIWRSTCNWQSWLWIVRVESVSGWMFWHSPFRHYLNLPFHTCSVQQKIVRVRLDFHIPEILGLVKWRGDVWV